MAINPWTGVDESRASQWGELEKGNVGGSSIWNQYAKNALGNPATFSQEQKMKQNVQQGSDFSGYLQSLNDLLKDPNKVTETAGYKFALDQGNQQINRSAAAKGMLNSGNVLAELAKYGQGMASQQYNTETNRLASLLGGAQQFGAQSNYYTPQQPTGVWTGRSYTQPTMPQASYW
jgi:hypothetical protein